MRKVSSRSMLFVIVAVALTACYSRSSEAQNSQAAEWEKIKDGKLCGISGIELIESDKQGAVVLIVHDK